MNNDTLKQLCEDGLNTFISDRKEQFPEVSPKQKEQWLELIYNQIKNTLGDNDIFYDNMPEDVIEN